ncbi:MAG: VOC family protein [Candidatus Limnocylindrales bacterium]
MWWGTAIEAPDPVALANFYSELLGWTVGHQEPGTAILAAPEGPVYIVFQAATDYEAPVWPPRDGAQRPMTRRRRRETGRCREIPPRRSFPRRPPISPTNRRRRGASRSAPSAAFRSSAWPRDSRQWLSWCSPGVAGSCSRCEEHRHHAALTRVMPPMMNPMLVGDRGGSD